MEKLKVENFSNVQSRDTSCTCGHCGNVVALDIFNKYYHTKKLNNVTNIEYDFYTGQCPFCGKPLIYDCAKKFTLPFVRQFENVQYLPEEIEKLYNECRDAYSASAFTCVVITGRTLMMNVAVNQGAEKNKRFIDYVDFLVENCLPKSSSKPWVDKIRILGNESAHEFVIAIEEQAKQSLKFLTQILRNVYELPNSI